MSPLDTIAERPLSQPTIDAVFTIAPRLGALPVEVHWRGRIHEIGIWQAGEWIGSVFRWPDAEGLGAWCSIGNQCTKASDPEGAVRRALWSTEKGQSHKPRPPARGVQSSGRIQPADRVLDDVYARLQAIEAARLRGEERQDL